MDLCPRPKAYSGVSCGNRPTFCHSTFSVVIPIPHSISRGDLSVDVWCRLLLPIFPLSSHIMWAGCFGLCLVGRNLTMRTFFSPTGVSSPGAALSTLIQYLGIISSRRIVVENFPINYLVVELSWWETSCLKISIL
jgi:hypothetical protein